ncbi:FlxA-like family protein [Peribacillus sp. NPDC097675]|uniref:FlxA-like family protein n=1 Tax=Peribacillus sp. NPDC097675 TaxID=3390618 RepID=UPI003D015871
MQILSSIPNYATTSYGTSSSTQSIIKDLEKQKTELQADIQEAYQANDTAEDKTEKVQQLQQEMQQLEWKIQQLQAEEEEEDKETRQVKVTTQK